jgi:hypothetical protein
MIGNPIGNPASVKKQFGRDRSVFKQFWRKAMGDEKRLHNGASVSAEPAVAEFAWLKLVDLLVPVLAGRAMSEQDELTYLAVRKVLPRNQVEPAIFPLQCPPHASTVPLANRTAYVSQRIQETARQFVTRRSESKNVTAYIALRRKARQLLEHDFMGKSFDPLLVVVAVRQEKAKDVGRE